MPRISPKKNKSPFQLKREEMGFSREEASERLGVITEGQLERMENGKAEMTPFDVIRMAETYNDLSLCNYYCTNECEIGKKYMPQIELKHLAQITLEIIASLNTLNHEKDRLVEISVDGKIENEEIKDFVTIQKKLDQISKTVTTLRFWTEQMLNEGKIDIEAYKKYTE